MQSILPLLNARCVEVGTLHRLLISSRMWQVRFECACCLLTADPLTDLWHSLDETPARTARNFLLFAHLRFSYCRPRDTSTRANDLAVDPRNIPPVSVGGGAAPLFPGIGGSELVAHGLDLSVQFTY
jgi:hypothetical protein